MVRSSRLFPPRPRSFPGKRWVDIGLRCAHLVGVAGMAGGFLFALPEAQWQGFERLTLASGGLLVLLYLWTGADWLLQLKGQAIVLKLVLLGLAHYQPEWRQPVFIGVIVLSGIFAHAPKRVRGYAWRSFPGRPDSATIPPGDRGSEDT